jgi:hypothetical protein
MANWQYSGSSDLNLKYLVQKFKLNEMAGKGREIEKMLNIIP